MSELLTPEQASQRLCVPISTLAVWRCTNRVKICYTKIGRAVRYKSADLDAFIEANTHGAPDAEGASK